MGLFNFYLSADKQQKEEKRCQKAAKKKIGAMDVALIISCIIMVVFTAVMIWLFVQFNSVPDTLIACVFTAICGEFGVLGWIKTTKCKNPEKKENTNEEAQG